MTVAYADEVAQPLKGRCNALGRLNRLTCGDFCAILRMSAEAAVSSLISKIGLVDNKGGHRSLEGKTTLLFYFSAHWCPPCRGFTPQLAQFYASHADSKSFEIIFVSGDNSEQEFLSYFKDMPWAAVAWGSMRSLKTSLELAYGPVSGIPTLIAVDLATMRLMTRSARSFVARSNPFVLLQFLRPLVFDH